MVGLSFDEMFLLIASAVMVTVTIYGLVYFLQRQRRRDEFEIHKWNAELAIRQEEMRQDRGKMLRSDTATTTSSSDTNSGADRPGLEEPTPYGGYVFVDVPDDYKGLFHDAIKGFEEYARLKGYRVNIAIDTTPPGKVGFRFTIANQGFTVSTETVRSDVDEYIAHFGETETFDELPIVIDPVEHERLKAALTLRYQMVRNNAEMHKTAADFYKSLAFEMSQLKASGVSYFPAPPTIIHNQLEQGASRTTTQTYSAEHSPGAAVGIGNTSSIEASTITIGSTLTEKNTQVKGLSEPYCCIKAGRFAGFEGVWLGGGVEGSEG